MRQPSKKYLITELISLFIIFPVFLGINSIPIALKLSFVPFVLIYLIYVCYTHRKKLFKKNKQIKSNQFWKNTAIRLSLIAAATILYVLYIDENLLFKAILTRPKIWFQMILIYTFLSVIPQEFVYRVFYFHRYKELFESLNAYFFINAILFSMAHLMFNSLLVLVMTFIGGYLFALTYHKTKSMFWTSIEHIIYGGWLFTVGMGKMLGFPI